MPRQPRYPLPSISQHVIQRGKIASPSSLPTMTTAFTSLVSNTPQHACAVYAYVLMTNLVRVEARR